jgi:putative peptidoglycan lipid II flippase
LEQSLKQPEVVEPGLVGTAGSIGAAILISRVLGLVRDMIQSRWFGAGLYTDAWTIAYRIPNLLRDLFAEGALSAAFIPTFIRRLTDHGKEEAWVMANRVISALLVILGGLTLVFFFAARVFVYALAYGYAETPAKFDLTVQMTQILSPFLLCLALASVAMGILNACGSFFIPAMASSAFNVFCILSCILLSPLMPHWGLPPVVSMAIGALVGGASQFLVMVPSAYRFGYRFRFNLSFSDPGLLQIARLMVPAVVGLSAYQINILVDSQIASKFGNGPVSWLSYGFRLMQFPIGIFGIAIATVTLSSISHLVARNETGKLHDTVVSSLRLAACLTFPATVGLIVFRKEIVQLIFEGGSFLPFHTIQTSHVVFMYALGLFSYSAVKILVPTFYALDDTRIPVRTSMITVAAKILLNFLFLLIKPLGFLGLALATTIASWLNFGLLFAKFRRKTGIARQAGELNVYFRIALASLVMGILSAVVFRGSWIIWAGHGTLAQALRLAVAISVAIASFFPILQFLKVEEGKDIVRLAAKMIGRIR